MKTLKVSNILQLVHYVLYIRKFYKENTKNILKTAIVAKGNNNKLLSGFKIKPGTVLALRKMRQEDQV